MKKLYIFCVLLGLASGSFAQVRLALVGGPQWSSVNETNSIPGWETLVKPKYSSKTGANLGILGQVFIGNSNKIFFQPGVLYSAKGRKFLISNDSVTAALNDTLRYSSTFATNYIEIPLNIGYRIPLGKKTGFFLSAGPYLGFVFSGKTTTEMREFSTNKFSKESADLEVGKGDNKLKLLDYGINARAGFDLNKVLISAYYTQGLSDFYQANYEGSFKHQTYGVSIGFWLNTVGPKKPRDKDKDGVPDTEDACPDLPGTALTKGCPDRDADGFADNEDNCPNVAGSAKYKGCPVPDSDKDGINDEEDKCPDVAGSSAYQGCPIPDRDKDGINDELDECPDKPGTREYKGCPIPDSDGDGLNDKVDKCPDVAGDAENGGCPQIKQEIVEKVNYAAKSIFFEKNSEKLLAKSFQSLDEVAKILQENPALHLTIEGYTDDRGNPVYNLALSEKRAKAVKAYLVKKGIAESKLMAKGFGAEKPVATNETADGRAQNRRVELKLEQD